MKLSLIRELCKLYFDSYQGSGVSTRDGLLAIRYCEWNEDEFRHYCWELRRANR